MSPNATDVLLSILEGQPQYVMEFTADFGGDPEEYLELAPGEQVDFMNLTPAQTGIAIRQWIETTPPEGLSADLDLAEVDWARVGAQLGRILGSLLEDM
jgi:hypothetical protein